MSKFHIIYPCGDRSKLSVCEICFGMEYELSDYSVASRNSFDSYAEAADYGQDLARNFSKTWVGERDQPEYLD